MFAPGIPHEQSLLLSPIVSSPDVITLKRFGMSPALALQSHLGQSEIMISLLSVTFARAIPTDESIYLHLLSLPPRTSSPVVANHGFAPAFENAKTMIMVWRASGRSKAAESQTLSKGRESTRTLFREDSLPFFFKNCDGECGCEKRF
ncbi:hypothetical protein PoB_005645700 [Plakobranchus ocellatus]|uniref:Uncharacterized protein n=1 Tax=Plakobranchus ocellatus TaxID=259542 RepID=A0AAV4CEH2_9GAST|nr:hypothetical protein PoB_005645700 [Plakobranchus ocellatus]